jgi:hypothetical protein
MRHVKARKWNQTVLAEHFAKFGSRLVRKSCDEWEAHLLREHGNNLAGQVRQKEGNPVNSQSLEGSRFGQQLGQNQSVRTGSRET